MHLGHRALIAHLARSARLEQATALAATFDPLPIRVLAPGAPPSALSDVTDRAKLLREAGADAVVVFRFDEAFARLSADEFVDRLRTACDLRRIVVGPDFHFGRRAEGDVEAAARPLGRPYSVRGRVVHGAKRGRALGFPTINLALPTERLLPRDGIYAVWAEMGEGRFKAAATLGVRPTFGGGERILEAYLLDFSGELYVEEVDVAFVKRLRDEIAFASPAELSAQIARDVEETRRALDG